MRLSNYSELGLQALLIVSLIGLIWVSPITSRVLSPGMSSF